MTHAALLAEVHALLLRTSMDELAAFAVIARRVMGKGRDSYGPTILANDARDYLQEAAEEAYDACWYLALHNVRRGRSKARVQSIDLVREFHERFGQAIEDEPSIHDEDRNQLRIQLLDEELEELVVALMNRDPVAVLDALTDLQYVLDGAYLSLGFAHVKDAALAEVHRSNMSKLCSDGKPLHRDDGKILKGPNYNPPDLRSIVAVERGLAELRDEAPALPPVPEFDVGGES